MIEHSPVRITIRYLGVVRLMSGRKEDVLQFCQPVTVEEVLARIKELLPDQTYLELVRQTLVLSPLPTEPGIVLSMPKDAGKIMKDGDCLTVVTPVTGG
ncbi:MoaD/ThiS family protein [Desulforamulus aeronauticus]|uniref:MoaD/ThiS family protein n=1 Tax=Desulforamulus aeronauticus DSM 10349 TaxID=1121421 RepID=A0A1M6TML2_9FIRM|nr:hypothetical protein [Desulforamulus aeronauticus]SHK58028.1 hypothetical protein SAMN02745123_02373 [Desulforamulus aeronauticus DSM 10349]